MAVGETAVQNEQEQSYQQAKLLYLKHTTDVELEQAERAFAELGEYARAVVSGPLQGAAGIYRGQYGQLWAIGRRADPVDRAGAARKAAASARADDPDAEGV